MSSGSARGYDRLARVYAGLERLAFGQLLMTARVALLATLATPARILIIGEGDGRMLAALLARYPAAQVDCVEQSAAMIKRARSRLPQTAKVRWLQQDAASFVPAPASYNCIITTFILDSFEGDGLGQLVARLYAALAPGGQWYYADFHMPERGWQQRRASLWLTLLYTFFRWQTGLDVRTLEDPVARFEALGLRQEASLEYSQGLLVTRVYRKAPRP